MTFLRLLPPPAAPPSHNAGRHRSLILISVVLLLATGATLASDPDLARFREVVAHDDSTTSARLFCATSSLGFVHHKWGASPLFDSAPDTISMPRGSSRPVLNVVMVQTTATEDLDLHAFEGLSRPWMAVFGIVGAIIGTGVAARLGKDGQWGFLIGGCILFFGAVAVFDSGTMKLYIDNATTDELAVSVDGRKPLKVPPKSHLGIKIREGSRHFVTTNADTGEPVEEFILNVQPLTGRNGKELDGYYIYNVAGKNRYRFTHTAYSPS